MLLAIGGFIAICVLSAYLTTTPEQRAEAQARFNRRWNWLWISIIVACLAVIFWPYQPN